MVTTMNEKTVGDRIREKRIEQGLTMEQLAEMMGYAGKTSVWKAEHYGNNVTATKIKKFAKALNCSFSELMGWDNPIEECDSKLSELIEICNKLTAVEKETVIILAKTLLNNHNKE